MKKVSLLDNLTYTSAKPKIDVLLESQYSKEIRIALEKNQGMKEHKTPFPITVEVFRGKIDFGVKGEKHVLSAGDLISLEGNISHDLHAHEPSIIRLSLAKQDSVERVRAVK